MLGNKGLGVCQVVGVNFKTDFCFAPTHSTR
jgi:hypothetical protein